jgi:hypothetical protein
MTILDEDLPRVSQRVREMVITRKTSELASRARVV